MKSPRIRTGVEEAVIDIKYIDDKITVLFCREVRRYINHTYRTSESLKEIDLNSYILFLR